MTRANERTTTKITIAIMVLLGTAIWSTGANGAGKKSNDVSKRDRYLLLDSRIIDQTISAKLFLGKVKKHTANPLFGEDKPWEPRFNNLYANVVYDREERLYKCWYSPFIVDESTSNTPRKDQVNGGKFRPRR